MLQRFFCSYVFSKFVTMNFVHLGPAWVSLTLLVSWFLSWRHKMAFLHTLLPFCVACYRWCCIPRCFIITLSAYWSWYNSIASSICSLVIGVLIGVRLQCLVLQFEMKLLWFGHRWFDVTMCIHILSHSSCLDLIFAANSERFESGYSQYLIG